MHLIAPMFVIGHSGDASRNDKLRHPETCLDFGFIYNTITSGKNANSVRDSFEMQFLNFLRSVLESNQVICAIGRHI